MKVLVIPSWYPPNGGFFFREHSIALANEDAKVDVIACHYRSLKSWKGKGDKFFGTKPIKTTKVENITEHSSYVWIIPFTEEPNFRCWVKKTWKMFHVFVKKHGKPDIIQAHSSFSAGYVASLIYKSYKIPYIITEHRSRFIYNCDRAKKLFKVWHYPVIKQALDDCSYLVGVSPALFPKLHEISHTSKSKSLVIHNMVDTEFFKPKKILAKKASTIFKFATVAYLKQVKGIDILLKAFNILHKSNPGRYFLNIAGDGVCRKELEQYVADNGLSEFVNFLGEQNREEVKELMQSSDAFVLPSRFEAFGVVYIEAMACGLPVVATKAGGPETFIPDFAGELCNVDDVKGLADNMKIVAENYHNYPQEKIRDYAVSNFSKSVVAKKYIEIYSNAINKSSN